MVSRVARNPIQLPNNVNITLVDQELTVKGKLGQLVRRIHSQVAINHAENNLTFAPVNSTNQANALAGTMRALVQNMVDGVDQGFQRKLTLIGVGYRAKVQGDVVNLTVGFSHPVDFNLPPGITAETPT